MDPPVPDHIEKAARDLQFRDHLSVALVVPEAPPAPPLGDSTLTGEVVDATTNRPVAGAEVKLVVPAITDAESKALIAQVSRRLAEADDQNAKDQ